MKEATLRQGKQVIDLLLNHGSSERLQRLFASGLLGDLLQADVNFPGVNRADFQRLIGLNPRFEEFTAVVDYANSLPEVIAASDHTSAFEREDVRGFTDYDRRGIRVMTWMQLIPGEAIEDEGGAYEGLSHLKVCTYMAKRYLKPAGVREMLAFDRQNPGIKIIHPVVGFQGGRAWTAIVLGDDTAKPLKLDNAYLPWNPRCSFLAIHM